MHFLFKPTIFSKLKTYPSSQVDRFCFIIFTTKITHQNAAQSCMRFRTQYPYNFPPFLSRKILPLRVRPQARRILLKGTLPYFYLPKNPCLTILLSYSKEHAHYSMKPLSHKILAPFRILRAHSKNYRAYSTVHVLVHLTAF